MLERQLLPGDTISLHLSYKGKIDEAICYLDVPFEERHNVGRYDPGKRRGLFNFGTRFAYLGENYTLLHPEILWYPVAVPRSIWYTILARENKFFGIYSAG